MDVEHDTLKNVWNFVFICLVMHGDAQAYQHFQGHRKNCMWFSSVKIMQ